MRKFAFWLFLCVMCTMGAGVSWGAGEVSSPLLVGGSFSTQVTNSSQTRVFDQEARDAEITSLREKLRDGQYNDVVLRINYLTAKNYVDDRFYLLLAIAFERIM